MIITARPSSFWRQIFPIRLLCDQSEVEILIGRLSCIITIFYAWSTWKLSHFSILMNTAFPIEWFTCHKNYRILSWVHFVYFLENHPSEHPRRVCVLLDKYILKTCCHMCHATIFVLWFIHLDHIDDLFKK